MTTPCQRWALGMAYLLLTLSGAQATPLTLSTAPPTNSGSEPRPNVIITVDDSGSMDWDINDNSTSTTANKKITLLKNALTATFGNTTFIPDGRIRLAWQAMWDNGNSITNNGAESIILGAKNSMRLFSGTHRTNFNSFVNSLTANNGTPSHDKFTSLFDYLNAPENIDSPWADTPGTSQTTPYIACRRTYHIFMTDGAWNSQNGPLCTDSGRLNSSSICDNSVPGNVPYYRCPSGYSGLNMSTSPPSCKKGRKKKDAIYVTGSAAIPNTSVAIVNPDYSDKGDGKTQTLGDGTTSYQATSTNDQIKVYRDVYGDNNLYASTIADHAFRNWAIDLQDGNVGVTQENSAGTTISGNTQNMANSIRPLVKRAGVETVTAGSASTQLQEFWNPKNDPATWQHVTQYMIGFGNGATTWGSGVAPLWGGNTYAGDYAKLINGSVAWPDVKVTDTGNTPDVRTADLWHGAINGRGKFIPATDAAALTQAFTDILGIVLADTSKPLITVTTSASTLRQGLSAFIAGYKAENWAGQLMARPLDATTAAVGSTVTWDATALLDDPAYSVANRLVVSNGVTGSASTAAGFSWKTYSSLPTSQQTRMNSNSAGTADSKGQDRVDYIRGDRTKEVAAGGTFRDRGSRLGDIVNSNIWYTGRPNSGYTTHGYFGFSSTATGGKGARTPMVYIGANDGMLHGVAAATTGSVAGGTELLAYIPQGVAESSLRTLTDTSYTHKYFVDGTPFTGDAYITTPGRTTAGWTTVLLGTLGAGGKGYFVLDVTDPADFTVANVANLVIKDTTDSLTGTKDADIGVITSPPVVDDAISSKPRQIVQLNNGRWAVVMGNGYNSVNEAPVLLIQYLDGDKSIKKLSPCAAPIASTACTFKGSNGLSSPALIDLDGNGKADVAYAGDLQGNLWKFNLSSATDSNWGVSFSGQPFFVAKGRATTATRPSATVTQAITSAPYFMFHPLGGVMVSGGTGRNLTDADQSSTGIDSYYALWDNSTFTSAAGIVTITDGTAINTTSATALPTTNGGLVEQTVTGTITDSGTTLYTSSTNAVTYTTSASTTQRGWYMDLGISTSERVLINTRLYTGETILVTTTVPKSGASSVGESCTASATAEMNYFYLLNMFTGKPPTTPAFDLTTTPTTQPNIIKVGGGDTAIVENTATSKKHVVKSDCAAGTTCASIPLNLGSSTGRRVSWRKKQ